MRKFLITFACVFLSFFMFAAPSNAETLIRFFNCDDECKAFVNGRLVLDTPIAKDTTSVNVDPFLTKPLGQNSIKIEVYSSTGGQTYGYKIVRDGEPIVSAECGKIFEFSCGGRDLGNIGLAYEFFYRL